MSNTYRIALIGSGTFLLLGGLLALVFGFMMTASAAQHVKSIFGAAVATASGAVVVHAGYTQRVPHWLQRLLGTARDDEA